MEEKNVEIVTKQFEDTNARNFEAVMNAYADDVMLILHGNLGPLSTEATGKNAVGEWFGDWFRQFGPDYRFDIEESRGSAERVFVVATHHGRGRASAFRLKRGWRTCTRCARVGLAELRFGATATLEKWPLKRPD